MSNAVATVTIVVRDYDEAIAWYVRCLGFELVSDVAMGPDKRWVTVAAPGGRGAALLLAKAATPEQAARIGDQTGGRVFLFLETDDFERQHTHMLEAGVRFLEEPRREVYGAVAVFEDVCGNRWDLIQHAR